MTDLDWPIVEEPGTQSARRGARRQEKTEALFREAEANPKARDALQPQASIRRRLLPTRRFASRYSGLLLIAAAAGLLLFGWVDQRNQPSGSSVTQSVPQATVGAVVSLPPPNLLKPVSREEAVKENAERPFANRPDTPASKFVLRTDADDHDRALNCLTQAVYYEAASEGMDGGRAVAQVVLNRMRHPGYPASICGVVYQGADRPFGCQFTFTCDGSLLRSPIAALWTRSRKIAEEALAGKVFAKIGHATHYHADYVLPYWADSLDKTVQIGRHIFYRLRSTPGDSRAFFQRYAGAEPQFSQPTDAVVLPPGAATDQLASALLTDAPKGATPEAEKAAPVASPLLADDAPATLVADEGGVAAPARKKKVSTPCPAASDGKQLMPLRSADMRAGVSTC